MNPANPYARVTWRGAQLTARQRQALYHTEQAIKQAGHSRFAFTVAQGSWRPRTPYSGTSHTGAGVADLEYAGIAYDTPTTRQFYRYVLRMLRDVGRQAAMGRGPWNAQIDGTGAMPLHFHTCDLDTHGAADTVAAFQVPQYRAGFDGLTAGHRDPFPWRPARLQPWHYQP